jgi:DNA-binding response OmpR family regulator
VGEILLIAADWQFRALVRAQLLEEGFSVEATRSLASALAHLAYSCQKPGLTILDVGSSSVEASSLQDLWQRTSQAPLILCAGAWSRNELTREGLPPAQVLLRPFCVGDLVAQVRKVLACPADDVSVV